MKWILAFLLISASRLMAQAPVQDANHYLQMAGVSKNAKLYYQGKLRPSDDEKTFSIFDSLNTKNNVTRPFYMYLVSRILLKADGALSEYAGVVCKKFLESKPDYLIEFLGSKNKLSDKNYTDDWASQIMGEFMISCEGKEKLCMKKSLQHTLKKCKASNLILLTAFYKKMERLL